MPITIGIPFYNAENFLADAIRSIFAQTYEDWELILVNDGSTDASLEIAYAVADSRVRVISDGQNRKLSFRLNQIVDEARYDLIGRMDADDLISPEKFEKQLPILSNDEIQIVTTGICTLSNNDEPLGYRIGVKPEIKMVNLLRGHGIAHAPILGRKSWFQQNRYNNAIARSQDAALWCSAARAGQLETKNVHVIEEPLYFFREHHGDLRRILQSHEVLRLLIRKYGPECLGRWGTFKELSRSHVRSLIFKACLWTGTANKIIDRRNGGKCDLNVLRSLQSEVDIVRSTKVPGLD